MRDRKLPIVIKKSVIKLYGEVTNQIFISVRNSD